jgi:adenylate cyclase
VGIYEPLGLAGQVDPAALSQIGIFHEALQHYRSRNWEQAVTHLRELQAMMPDTKLYTLFLDRIARLRANPPGVDWDGAFTFESK